MCNEKKETAKICGTFLSAALVQRRTSARKQPYTKDDSGFLNFVGMTKSDFEVEIQKIGPRIQRKNTKYFGTQFLPRSVRFRGFCE